MKTKLLLTLALIFMVFPSISFAADPSIFQGVNIWQGALCGGSSPITIDQGPPGPCSFCDAIIVAKNIMRYAFELIFYILFPAFFAWGAFQYMTSAGNPAKLKHAKQILISTVVGFAIAAASWLIVGLLFSALSGIGTGKFSFKTINQTIECNQVK